MHSLIQKAKGNGGGKTEREGKEASELPFKQMPVPIRSRGNTSTVFDFLCFYDIDVT